MQVFFKKRSASMPYRIFPNHHFLLELSRFCRFAEIFFIWFSGVSLHVNRPSPQQLNDITAMLSFMVYFSSSDITLTVKHSALGTAGGRILDLMDECFDAVWQILSSVK